MMKMVRIVPMILAYVTRGANFRAASDPFETHFANPDESELARRLQAVSENRWHCSKKLLPDDFRLAYSTPEIGGKEEHLPSTLRDIGSVKVR